MCLPDLTGQEDGSVCLLLAQSHRAGKWLTVDAAGLSDWKACALTH